MNEIEKLIQELCPDGVEYRRLGEVCVLQRGKVISKDYIRDNQGIYPVYSSQTANNGILGYIDSFMFDGDYLTWTTDGAYAGTVFRRKGKFNITNVCGLINSKADFVNQNFLYFWLSMIAKNYVSEGMGNPKLMSNVLSTIPIPLPPITIQEKIVEILDKFTSLEAELKAELEARRKQYEYYREKLLTFSPEEVEYRRLGEVADCYSGATPKTSIAAYWENGTIPWMNSGEVNLGRVYKTENKITKAGYDSCSTKMVPPHTVVVALAGQGKTRGTVAITEIELCTNQSLCAIKVQNEIVNSYYLYHYLRGQYLTLRKISSGDGTRGGLNQNMIRNFEIPLPPLSEQRRIVEILDRFEALTNDLQAGLPAEIAARRQQYEYYREKLLTFKRKTV